LVGYHRYLPALRIAIIKELKLNVEKEGGKGQYELTETA